ncbi:MAG: fatty acid desaturase [Planctomycetota bacterium]|jgi:fatty acid desaturase
MNSERAKSSQRPLKQSRASVPRRRILAHPQDIHCVVYHLFTLVAYAAAFWVWLNPDQSGVNSNLERVVFVLGAGLLLGWSSGVDVGVNFHNHTHRRIFKAAWLNRWFGRFWTFSGGWPSYYWQHAHVVVHHANILEDNDWTIPKRNSSGEFENIYRYLFAHWPWRYAGHLYKDFTTGVGGHRVLPRAIFELGVFAILWSIPFAIDPVMGVCLWLFPHWIGNLVMAAGMYVQHSGCRSKSEAEYLHSTTFLSKFFNMTMFNIGYHIEHHDNPAVHWSVLPRLHQEFAPKLREANAHVVPYGYFKAAHIISSNRDGAERFAKDSAPGYPRFKSVSKNEITLKPFVPTPSRFGGAKATNKRSQFEFDEKPETESLDEKIPILNSERA